jgi:hypothetical protein
MSFSENKLGTDEIGALPVTPAKRARWALTITESSEEDDPEAAEAAWVSKRVRRSIEGNSDRWAEDFARLRREAGDAAAEARKAMRRADDAAEDARKEMRNAEEANKRLAKFLSRD